LLSFGAESLSSSVLPKNMKIKVYGIVILPVFFCMGVKLGRLLGLVPPSSEGGT